ncbi:MAG: hypothetical protein AB8F74_21820 [Saprospiraceae bacterium]
MKTFKSVILSSLVIAATLFSTTASANNIVETRNAQVRAELTKMIQNPDLKAHGISESELYIQFTVDESGEILLTAINTDSDYLVAFAKEKLHHQKLDLADIPPNSTFNLRVKFELQ